MRTLITLAFLASALWFATLSGVGAVPLERQGRISAEALSTAPRRVPMQDPPRTRIGGLDQECSSCHAIFSSTADEPAERLQHTHIVLEHGLNNRCDNCHTKGDHDKLRLYAGEEVGFSEVQRLCAKCHGPTFRDWELGIHGKTLGSWEAGRPERHMLLCTECHDPHHPAFPAYEPLRGPHTLRQHATTRGELGKHEDSGNPLRRWQGQGEHSGHEHGGEE